MHVQDKRQLKRVKRTWQTRQDAAGAVTFCLAVMTFCSLLNFLRSPTQSVAGLMGGLMILLSLACGVLVCSAAKVAAIRQTLKPPQLGEDRRQPSAAEAFRRHGRPLVHSSWDDRN